MVETSTSFGRGEVDALILEALVRRLLAKGVLSQDDVRTLLLDAVTHLDRQTRASAPGAADQT